MAAPSEETSAIEAGIGDELEHLYANGKYEEAAELLESGEVSSTTKIEEVKTQPRDSDGEVSIQHWYNKGDSTVTHTGFLWKKSSNHSSLENDVYQFDVSWDLNRTSQDAFGLRLDSPAPMDQSIIAFDKSRFDYLPSSHPDGGLRHSGSIFDDDGSEWESGQSYVKNEPTPIANRQDAAVVSFDDGEVFTNLDNFPSQGRGHTGLRLAHVGSNPGAVETYFEHTWSAMDFGRWTGVLGDLTVDLPWVSISLDVPTGVDSWSNGKAFYKG